MGHGLSKAVFEKYAVKEYGDPDKDKPLNDFTKDAGDDGKKIMVGESSGRVLIFR